MPELPSHPSRFEPPGRDKSPARRAVVDDHSRYSLGLYACGNERTETVKDRLVRHLRRRSQRRHRPPIGVSFYRHLADLGLVYL
ncbi:MAG: hypothetical protein V3S64_07640 [bacterium]